MDLKTMKSLSSNANTCELEVVQASYPSGNFNYGELGPSTTCRRFCIECWFLILLIPILKELMLDIAIEYFVFIAIINFY